MLEPITTLKLRSICTETAIQILVTVGWLCSEAFFLHSINKEVLGILTVRLELLRQTITFAKPAFLFKPIFTRVDRPTSVTLLWLWICAVSISTIVFCNIWLGNWIWLELPSEKYLQDYMFAVTTIGISCVIEALSEPAHMLSKSLFYSKWESYLNKAPTYLRIMILVVAVNYFPEHTIRATAYGELAISTLLVAVYWLYFLFGLRTKTECVAKEEGNIKLPMHYILFYTIAEMFPSRASLDGKLFKAILQILQQRADWLLYQYGEKYVMTFVPMLSIGEQGIYNIVTSLGERISSCVFTATERESFFYYAPQLKSCGRQTTRRPRYLSNGLSKFLRMTALMACIVLIFGLSYSRVFAQKYAGNLLIEWPGSWLLKVQCLIVFLKAIGNGAGAYAALLLSSASNYNYDMGIRNLTYITLVISGLLSYLMGSFGFAVGNCCKFGFLVLHNIRLIRQDYQETREKPLLGLFPNKIEALALGTALAITLWSELVVHPISVELHLVLGTLVAVLVVGSILFTELRSDQISYVFDSHPRKLEKAG